MVQKDAGHLHISKNITRVHYIDDIMLIQPSELEIISILDALVSMTHAWPKVESKPSKSQEPVSLRISSIFSKVRDKLLRLHGKPPRKSRNA